MIFTDDLTFIRQSPMIRSLYVGGRLKMIRTIKPTQKFNAYAFINEVVAALDNNTALELVHKTTSQPYSFYK